MTHIPMTQNNLMTAYSIALKQIVESNATDEQKAMAKASLDELLAFNLANHN